MKHTQPRSSPRSFSPPCSPACSCDDSGAQPVTSSGVRSVLVSVTPSVPPRRHVGAGFAARRCRGRGAPYNAASSTFSHRYDVTTGALRVTHANAALRSTGARDIRAGFRPRPHRGEHHHRARAAAGGGRRALGLHDISFGITNLPVRAYRVVVIEPWVEKTQRPLSFRMDLVESLSGAVSAERSQSPWGDIASL